MKAGDELKNPVTVERAVVRSGSEDTNGEFVLTDLFVRPGGRVALPHLHPALTETFEVVAGRIDFVRDGERSIAAPGQKVAIPPGTVHDWWNDGDADAHVRVEVRGPGTARFELMIETFWGLARDGKTNDKGAPNPLRLAVTAREFADVLIVAKPAPLVQKIVFGAPRRSAECSATGRSIRNTARPRPSAAAPIPASAIARPERRRDAPDRPLLIRSTLGHLRRRRPD
jgi:mannose-6-phosphate isomerase-like protein (cupin superfamily)